MSHFFLFSSNQPNTVTARARSAFSDLKGIAPAAQWQERAGDALTFNASGGRGVPVVRDSSKWLAVVGTWFDTDGLGPGDESKLLAQIGGEGLEVVLARLEGFFVLVLGDDDTGEVKVITDLAGSCHCYLRQLDSGVAVCTSSAVLAALGTIELDPVGAQEFVNTGVIFEERSLWCDVAKLPAAQVLSLRGGRVTDRRRYWRFADIEPQRLTLEQSVERISAALASTARRIGAHFPKPLCDLTGGYDSRATIAGFLLGNVPVSTTVSGAPDNPDVVVSTQIAEAFGLQHRRIERLREVTLTHLAKAFAYCDGECDLFEYARIATTHEGHAAQFGISVNGSFGELARGYWWELLLPNLGAQQKLDYGLLASKRYAAMPFDASVFEKSQRRSMPEHFTEALARAGRDIEHFPNTSQMDNAYFALRMQRWQGRIASSTNHIWPAVSPYAFRSLLIPVLETQWRARIRSLVVRTLLQKKLPKLGNLPLEHGYPAVPATLWNIHRFWHVPVHYADRVQQKLRRLAGRGRTSAGGSASVPVTAVLGAGDEARALLSFGQLAQSPLFDAAYLRNFAANAAAPGFAFRDQYTRLVTVEYALGRLRSLHLEA